MQAKLEIASKISANRIFLFSDTMVLGLVLLQIEINLNILLHICMNI